LNSTTSTRVRIDGHEFAFMKPLDTCRGLRG
jgi:hypothetical protein